MQYQEDMASILYHLAQGKEAFLDYVKDSIVSHVRPQLGLHDDIWPCNLVERVAMSLLLHWGTPAPQWRYTSLGVIYDAEEFPDPSDVSDDEMFQECGQAWARTLPSLKSKREYAQVWMQIKFTVAELHYVKWHLWFVMASLVLYQRWGSPCAVTLNRMSDLALVMPKKVNDWHGEKVPITKLVVTWAKHKKKTSGGSGGGSSSGAGPSSYYNQYDGGLPSIPDAVEED
ncbi:hypothetical protein K439DRAFT_1554953 [Ramaria rubella]|nr:hypothetical protein K439DRAFT_1554953 [Ramaria rubella]